MSRTHPRLRYPAAGVRWPDDATLNAMIAAEALRSERRYGGRRDDMVRATSGNRVLLTAPHAVAHGRLGVRKAADMGTGFLTEALADACGAATLIAEGEQVSDGNFDAGSLFRTQLAPMLAQARLLLDVHGMSDGYGVDVCLGSGRRPDLSGQAVDALARRLQAAGFIVSVDDPYDAYANDTVTRAAHAAGVPAVQIEVTRSLRRHLEDPEPCLLLVETIAAAIGDLVPDAAR